MGENGFEDRRHNDRLYHRLEARIAMLEAAVRDRVLQEQRHEEWAEKVDDDHENRLRMLQDLASQLKGSIKVLNWLVAVFGMGGVGGIVIAIIKLSH